MIKRGFGLLVVAAMFAGALPANAVGNVRRETPARRPYIVEVGEPYEIGMQTLQAEADNISELREYLQDYGNPDYAEIQEIEPQWPWAYHEVRAYYLRRNLEVDFGHVILSPAVPNLGVIAFQGEIPADKAHQIEVILQARQAPAVLAPPMAVAPPPRTGGLNEAVARIEAAAERAAQAADRAVSESAAALSAAERTENIVNKLEEGAPSARQRSR